MFSSLLSSRKELSSSLEKDNVLLTCVDGGRLNVFLAHHTAMGLSGRTLMVGTWFIVSRMPRNWDTNNVIFTRYHRLNAKGIQTSHKINPGCKKHIVNSLKL
jgi:hypothetical protein